MSNDGVNTSRRTFLIGLTSAIGAAGAVGAAVPFVKSWQPSAKAKNAGAPVTVDIGKLEPGQRVVEEWRGQPVWVVRRTDDMLQTLPQLESKLSDPASEADQQPAYAQNEWGVRRCMRTSLRWNWSTVVFSAPVTVPSLIWPVASTRACPHPPTWWCRRTLI